MLWQVNLSLIGSGAASRFLCGGERAGSCWTFAGAIEIGTRGSTTLVSGLQYSSVGSKSLPPHLSMVARFCRMARGAGAARGASLLVFAGKARFKPSVLVGPVLRSLTLPWPSQLSAFFRQQVSYFVLLPVDIESGEIVPERR